MRDLKQFLDTLMLERINKVDTHHAFRASRGLCGPHGWALTTARGGSLGIAVMYESTMYALLKADLNSPSAVGRFGRLFGNQAAGDAVADRLEANGPCIACESMNKSENSYLGIIADNLSDESLRTAYDSSLGLCLPHVRLLLRRLTDPAHIGWISDVQTRIWQVLHADLQRYIDNNEANIPEAEYGAEGDSWQRAVRYFSGEPGVFGLRRNQES